LGGFLRTGAAHSHAVEQRVEWLYAFDIHCNAFFPLFIMLYVVQLILSPILLAQGGAGGANTTSTACSVL
jgi:hypothetical protein